MSNFGLFAFGPVAGIAGSIFGGSSTSQPVSTGAIARPANTGALARPATTSAFAQPATTAGGFSARPTIQDPISNSFSTSEYPAVVYCGGAIATGADPAKRRFQEKQLEKAYRRVVCECDPKAVVSCECLPLEDVSRDRAKAEVAMGMVAMALNLSTFPEFATKTDEFLQSLITSWIVVIVDANTIFAFNGCASRKQRRCVTRGMMEEVTEIIIESDRLFGPNGEICKKREECGGSREGRCPRKCDHGKRDHKHVCDCKKGRRHEDSSEESY